MRGRPQSDLGNGNGPEAGQLRRWFRRPRTPGLRPQAVLPFHRLYDASVIHLLALVDEPGRLRFYAFKIIDDRPRAGLTKGGAMSEESLLTAAAQLRQLADQVNDIGARALRETEIEWKSLAAEEFRAQLRDCVRAIAECARRFEHAANAVRRHAVACAQAMAEQAMRGQAMARQMIGRQR